MVRLIIMPIVAGFIATGGITFVLWLINKSGWTNADMVRAVGSFFTKSYHNSLQVGLFVHFITGIVIAGVYLHILSILSPPDMLSLIVIGGVIGFGHGFVVSYGIVKFAHLHPIEEFQKADYQVAIAHIIGHTVYGMLMGLIFGILRLMGYDVSPGI